MCYAEYVAKAVVGRKQLPEGFQGCRIPHAHGRVSRGADQPGLSEFRDSLKRQHASRVSGELALVLEVVTPPYSYRARGKSDEDVFRGLSNAEGARFRQIDGRDKGNGCWRSDSIATFWPVWHHLSARLT